MLPTKCSSLHSLTGQGRDSLILDTTFLFMVYSFPCPDNVTSEIFHKPIYFSPSPNTPFQATLEWRLTSLTRLFPLLSPSSQSRAYYFCHRTLPMLSPWLRHFLFPFLCLVSLYWPFRFKLFTTSGLPWISWWTQSPSTCYHVFFLCGTLQSYNVMVFFRVLKINFSVFYYTVNSLREQTSSFLPLSSLSLYPISLSLLHPWC